MAKYILSLFIIGLLLGCNITKTIKAPFECELLDNPIQNFKFDVFGNLYTIDLKNRLKVYDKDLNFLFEYYNNSLGNISYVDVTNPKKIMLFFSGFQRIIFVDDALSEIGRYQGEFNIIAAGNSSDNNIWIYDGLDYRLKKISKNSKVIIESNPVESYIQLDIHPDFIVEQNNMVFMVEEGRGIAIFDNFGNYSSYLPLEDSGSIIVKDKSIVYTKGGILYQQLTENTLAQTRKIKTIPAGAEIVRIFNKSIFYTENRCLKKITLD
ncbi:hypothetical protein [Portibacter lacus]|uniref:Uncharacterized protein n=1 Tax=Portibacter lacus TaxID=1099794 RepID=A0AA37WFL7_9BACT|nr:hypothetical protein [Portibacter lacus]GLR18792.1 hypothetical protein GCM10007940_34080 [Portibacter lacus]